MATLAEISRYILLTLTNVLSLYAVLCLVLKKKRSARSMLMYMMGKMIVVNIFFEPDLRRVHCIKSCQSEFLYDYHVTNGNTQLLDDFLYF